MKTKYTFILLTVVFTISSAFATNQIITFGNSLTYSPANASIMVGDTVTWQGDFATHPLSTTAKPTGALDIIHVNIGTTYMYIVSVPGSYSYQCDAHFSMGMTGSFIVNPVAGVEEATAKPVLLFNLSNWGGVIRISDQSEPNANNYRVHIGNILGESVYEGTMSSREQEKIIDLQDQPKGIYLVAITDQNRQTFLRKIMLQ